MDAKYMVCGISDQAFIYLIIITVSLVAGFIIGVSACIVVTQNERNTLEKEIDKFRDLYFEEMDKWKNKYDNDDYEAY